MVRMTGQAVGQSTAAFEHAKNIQDERAERRTIGQFRGDGERAIHGHARAQKRRDFLSKEQDVALPASRKRRQLDFNGRLGFLADIDRRKPLAPQFEGNQPLGFGVNGAGANLPIGCYGAEVKVSHRRSSVFICGHCVYLWPIRILA